MRILVLGVLGPLVGCKAHHSALSPKPSAVKNTTGCAWCSSCVPDPVASRSPRSSERAQAVIRSAAKARRTSSNISRFARVPRDGSPCGTSSTSPASAGSSTANAFTTFEYLDEAWAACSDTLALEIEGERSSIEAVLKRRAKK